jgi:hypothetical protein
MLGPGLAARGGVLIKNATRMETSEPIDTVVMDKTGTLKTAQGGGPYLSDQRFGDRDCGVQQCLYQSSKQARPCDSR